MFFRLICIGFVFHSVNHVVCVSTPEFNKDSLKMGSENFKTTPNKNFEEYLKKDFKEYEDRAKQVLGNGLCDGIIDEAIDILKRVLEFSGKHSRLRSPEPERYCIPLECIEILEEKTPEPKSAFRPMDCAEILEEKPSSKSGVYTIWLKKEFSNSSRIEVYCDMEDDGGGWTVIQRRGDYGARKDYFWRDWIDYKNGFGNLNKDFWLGNDNIFALTHQNNNSLKFELEDWEGNRTFAVFNEFLIDDELHKYTLHVDFYHGTAGDSFSSMSDYAFTTRDRDNDPYPGNCAKIFKGAWWYTYCGPSNINALYSKEEQHNTAMFWEGFRGWSYSLKYTTMKIRPKLFKREGLSHK